MKNETEIIEIKPKNMYIPICITQAICVTVILIFIFIIKSFFSDSYKLFNKWYAENLLEETVITADFSEENSSET